MRYSAFYEDVELDFDRMRAAADLIQRTNDFRALCKRPDQYHDTLCLISHCALYVNEEQGRLRFTITGNRFLRGMVRLCMFFMLKVGTGEMSLADFEAILNQEKDLKEKQPALPNGLFLSKIEYPFLKLENRHQLIRMMKVGLD